MSLDADEVAKTKKKALANQAALVAKEGKEEDMTVLPYGDNGKVSASRSGMSSGLNDIVSLAQNVMLAIEMFTHARGPYPDTKVDERKTCAKALWRAIQSDMERFMPAAKRAKKDKVWVATLAKAVRRSTPTSYIFTDECSQIWPRRHQARVKPMNIGRVVMFVAFGLGVYRGKKKLMRGAINELLRHKNYLCPGRLTVSDSCSFSIVRVLTSGSTVRRQLWGVQVRGRGQEQGVCFRGHNPDHRDDVDGSNRPGEGRQRPQASWFRIRGGTIPCSEVQACQRGP